MRRTAAILIVLNWLDMLLTLAALGIGCAELNPLMRCVPVMVIYKAVAVPLLAVWLGRQKTRLAQCGMAVCAAMYGALAAWHVVGWIGIALVG